ncbi:metal-chelation protein CHAD [Pseudomonas abyssi]|uniref:Metal-chelation protein CHAD n=2 Tax=Pseudomonas abyssi TaxID=170540 RepID=A0A2A3MFT7_9PSED|nr:metal-chelation protein CHAD [Pseudomonas abyssi]
MEQGMFLDKYVAEIQNLTAVLRDAYRRLDENTDDEALHDLRIAVRRIRSLLGPLGSLPENQALREAAAEVGRLTTPTRDLEVLIAELDQRGYSALADGRRKLLQAEYREIVQAPELQRLFAELKQWPAAFARSDLGGDSPELKRIIGKALNRQVRKLYAGVTDAEFDRHKLRILVKRTRYITDAFPSLSPLPAVATTSLKKAQSALGGWHDHYQWCLRGQQEVDLEPLVKGWSKAQKEELKAAEAALKKLANTLPSEHAMNK